MISESEAKKKWCPFAMAPHTTSEGVVVGANRYLDNGEPDADCLCLGTRCMVYVSRKQGRKVEGMCGVVSMP